MAKKKNSTKSTTKKNLKPVRKVVAEIVSDDHEILDQPTPLEPEPLDEIEIANTDENSLAIINNKLKKPTDLVITSKDPLAMYLNELRKYPLLSREEEFRIAQNYFDTKDPAAAQKLVQSNLRFVVKIAAEYAKFSSRMIDLIQEGNVGLMHAVKEYNPHKGARLITYAVWWIRGYIQEYLMRQFSVVRIGTTANQRKLFYQLQKQKSDLEKMMSEESLKELSLKLGIPEDEIIEMSKRLSGRDVSLDKPVGDDDSISLGSLLKKEDGSLPLDDQMALEEQIALLKNAIDKIYESLNDKEKILLSERILNDEPLTLQEIGEKYGISREAVRQNEVRLIQKIKSSMGI